MRISVLGAGSWGSALAILFSKIASINLWSRNEEQLQYLRKYRTNPEYLPADIVFPSNIQFTSQISEAISSCDLVIIATPLNSIRQITRDIRQNVETIPDLILVSKGFEANTGLLPHAIIAEELPGFDRFGLLIGPSFAREVALNMPTAITLASLKLEFATSWMNKLKDLPNFRIYAHDDVIGSEVGSAVKNVLAIAVGISDGLKLGFNARAALITRSLNELGNLVLALGGRRETIYGLTGIGDLILTCTGDLSRNRQVGQELALGKKIDEIVNGLGHVAEGVSTAREIYKLAEKLNIEMPIVTAVYKIIYCNQDIKEQVLNLISRQPKLEF